MREWRGSRSIVRTGFHVDTSDSLNYWSERLNAAVIDVGGRATIEFQDPEGQRLSIVAERHNDAANPWEQSPVPPQHQIRGLGPITLSVPDLQRTDAYLTGVMQMRKVREFTAPMTDGSEGTAARHVYDMGGGGAAAELHVAVESSLGASRLGAGGVHHVAFRVPTFEQHDEWSERLEQLGVRFSGPIDRFYFRSHYFREPNGILFELATDGPGFAADEAMEKLGRQLALPPFLEPRRAEIEAGLKPLPT